MRFLTFAAVGALALAAQAQAEATLDLVGPISDYKIYVSEQVDTLVTDTEAFVAAVSDLFELQADRERNQIMLRPRP